MYYAFKKGLIWVLLTLSILVSIACILIAALQQNKEAIQSYYSKNS
jgi:hypothetical protein